MFDVNEMDPEKVKRVRHYIAYVAMLLLLHVVSLVFYALFVGNMVRPELLYPDGRQVGIVVTYSLLLTVLFHVVLTVAYARNGEERRAYLELTREGAMPLVGRFRRIWREQLYHTLILLGLQLPFRVFYASADFVFGDITVFEMLFAVDASFYLLTDNFALGYLLNGLLHFLLFVGGRLLAVHLWERERL